MREQETPRTILLVEDEALIAVMERETLKRHGYNVVLASSGEKAIEAARTYPEIELILMDINLGKGKMDGTETAEVILSERDIPILFLSSYTQAEVVEKTENITSYGYVVKDSGETVLLTSIKMALKLYEALNKVQEQKYEIEAANEELHAALTQIEMSNRMLTASYAEMMEGKELFRTTLYSIGDGVIIANAHGFVRYMNPVAEKLTGWTEKEARGKNIDEIFHIINEEKRNIVEDPVKRVLREGTVVGLANHTLLISKDGNEIPIADSGSPIKDAEGKIFGVVLVFSDQSAERAISKKIEESEERFRNLYQESSIPTFTWQKKGNDFILADFNRAADQISQGKVHDFLGNSAVNMYKNRPQILINMDICFKEQRALRQETFSEDFASGKFLLVNFSFIPPDMVIVHLQDQSELKEVQGRLRESEEIFDLFMEHSPIYVFFKDENIRVLKLSKNFEAMLGKPLHECIGKTMDDLFPADFAKSIIEDDRKVLREGKPIVVHEELNGRFYTTTKFPILREGKSPFLAGFVIDATEQKRIEAVLESTAHELRERVNELHCLFNVSSLIEKHSNDIPSIAQGTADMLPTAFRYPEYACSRITIDNNEYQSENFRETLWKLSSPAIFHGRHKGSVEVFYVREMPVHDIGPFLNSERDLIHIIAERLVRVMERVEAEEALKKSEQQLINIIEFLPDATLVVDREGKVIAWNNAIEKMTGVSAEDMIGKDNYAYAIPFYGKPRPILIDLVFGSDHDVEKQYDFIKKQGNTYYTEVFIPEMYNGKGAYLWATASKLFDSEGNIIGAIESIRDISYPKRAEDKIKSLLSEKELLLREVHHRIKNNMSVITGMLMLQADTLKDPSAITALKDAQGRVRSMMVLYDKLYRSANFRAISAKEYLTSLIDEIIVNFPDYGQVTVEKQIDDFILDAKILSPLGIILNELLTNAMKHAFTNKDKGLIHVFFSIKDNHATLIVQDNGAGIPGSIDIGNSTGFGLQLVSMLTEQLEGTMRIEREKGMRFVMEFEIQ